ncbi:MAG: hypothetical protein GX638_18430 [Crenarchaeota archaeon]|nr:hypothetical protein [Thermoproteota archaeon]
MNFAYPTKPVVVADEYYDQPEGDVTKINTDGGVFDEFGVLVFDKTMLRVFSKYYKTTNPALENHINMISFVTEKLGRVNRDEPVFVYSHLMLPHMPFMFDKNGNLNIALYHQNWDYYLGHYQFTISVIEELITNILSQYGPDDQPVIILQSDHGARNKKTTNPESKDLADYPEEYKTLIMNALFIPQCEPNQFKEDMNPVNTFPLIYNCLFGDSIPMVESGSVP